MAFTDRFFKCPVEVYDKSVKDLTGKENCVMSYTKILPFEIAEYRPTWPEGQQETEYTPLSMKNGAHWMVCWPVKEFEEKINQFIISQS